MSDLTYTGEMGVMILDLWELQEAVVKKRAVFAPDSPNLQTPKPAAVIMNWPGRMILKLIQEGLFIYEKETP